MASFGGNEESVELHYDDVGNLISTPSIETEEVVNHSSYGNSPSKSPRKGRSFKSQSSPPSKDLKRPKSCLLKCNHGENDHFEKTEIANAIERNQLTIIMNPPSDSIIWSFCGYPEFEDKFCATWIVCTVCKNIFSVHAGTTSGAKRHIESKHALMIDSVKQMSRNSDNQFAAVYGCSLPTRVVCDNDRNKTCRVSPRKRNKKVIDTNEDANAAETIRVVFDEETPTDEQVVVSGSKVVIPPNHNSLSPMHSTVCSACNIDFRNTALALIHRGCHGNGGRFHCAQCGVILTNVFDFWAHLVSRSCN